MIRLIVARNDFARIAGSLGAKVTEVVVATALDVEGTAKALAPVKTGNLRRSLTTQPIDPFHVLVGTDVEYAPYVEYGSMGSFSADEGGSERVMAHMRHTGRYGPGYVVDSAVSEHRRMRAAHPYLTPAVEGERSRFISRLGQVFGAG